MKYEKPNIAVIASAVEAVKNSSQKGLNNDPDTSFVPTIPAYESDE
jgi:hypothetical protein